MAYRCRVLDRESKNLQDFFIFMEKVLYKCFFEVFYWQETHTKAQRHRGKSGKNFYHEPNERTRTGEGVRKNSHKPQTEGLKKGTKTQREEGEEFLPRTKRTDTNGGRIIFKTLAGTLTANQKFEEGIFAV